MFTCEAAPSALSARCQKHVALCPVIQYTKSFGPEVMPAYWFHAGGLDDQGSEAWFDRRERCSQNELDQYPRLDRPMSECLRPVCTFATHTLCNPTPKLQSRESQRHALALTMASMSLLPGYTIVERSEWVRIVDDGFDDAPARVAAPHRT